MSEQTAKTYVLEHHYSGSYPTALRRFGLFELTGDGPRLVGVAVFGAPVSAAVLTNVFDLEPYVESMELSRFVLDDEVPANAESWFLARCHNELLAGGVRGVVSFADPVPRPLPHGAASMSGTSGSSTKRRTPSTRVGARPAP